MPAPRPEAPQPAPVPEEVQVTLETMPVDAIVKIDGLPYMHGTFSRKRSLDPVLVHIEKPGYQAQEQAVIFDRDRQLTYTLHRGHGTHHLAAESHAPTVRTTGDDRALAQAHGAASQAQAGTTGHTAAPTGGADAPDTVAAPHTGTGSPPPGGTATPPSITNQQMRGWNSGN